MTIDFPRTQLFIDTFNNRDLFDDKVFSQSISAAPPEKSEYAYALILTYHPRLRLRYKQLIQEFNIRFAYPQHPTIKEIIDMSGINYQGKVEEVTAAQHLVVKASKDLVEVCRLHPDWTISLSIKLTTDVLPIPNAIRQIEFLPHDKVNDNIYYGYSIYPNIILKEKISRNAFFAKVTEIWDSSIEPALNELPVRQFDSIDFRINDLTFGVWAYSKVELEGISLDLLEEEIRKVEDIQPNYFSFSGNGYSKEAIRSSIRYAKDVFEKVYPLG